MTNQPQNSPDLFVYANSYSSFVYDLFPPLLGQACFQRGYARIWLQLSEQPGEEWLCSVLEHEGSTSSYYEEVDYLCKLWKFTRVCRAKILYSCASRCPILVSEFQDFSTRALTSFGYTFKCLWGSVLLTVMSRVCGTNCIRSSTIGDKSFFVSY